MDTMPVLGVERLFSWGRVAAAESRVARPRRRDRDLPVRAPGETILPYGKGRSYGDVCLNPGGLSVVTDGLDHLISFDPERGLLEAESGVTLGEVLRVIVPRGWFLPVTPGTKHVTLGGALANDVHGKNHHAAGTFGRHVESFELLRSDGRRLSCSASENAELYGATIGGLGLTGLVTRLTLRLRAIRSSEIETETVRFGDLDEFLALTARDREHEHAVAWIDALGSRTRGTYFFGDHAQDGPLRVHGDARLRVPCDAPAWLLGAPAARAFNALYYRTHPSGRARVHYAPFFYPLDVVEDWNRLYGPRGFFQYQCVIPEPDPAPALRELLREASRGARGSFLCVLKRFGDVRSPGWLSFPVPGVTACLDFPNDGARGEALFRRLDAVVRAAGGRLYPAKDARMSAEDFRRSYPRWSDLARVMDPAFGSSFWRRVGGASA